MPLKRWRRSCRCNFCCFNPRSIGKPRPVTYYNQISNQSIQESILTGDNVPPFKVDIPILET
jgi:hypothetical protein